MSQCNPAVSIATFLALLEMEKREVLDIDGAQADDLIMKMEESMKAHSFEKSKKSLRFDANHSGIEYNIIAKSLLGGINFLEDVTEPITLSADGETYQTSQDVDITFTERAASRQEFQDATVAAQKSFRERVRLPFADVDSVQMYRVGDKVSDVERNGRAHDIIHKMSDEVFDDSIKAFLDGPARNVPSFIFNTVNSTLFNNGQTIVNGLVHLNGKQLEDTVYPFTSAHSDAIKSAYSEFTESLITHAKEIGSYSDLEDSFALSIERISGSDNIIAEAFESVQAKSDEKVKNDLFFLLLSSKTESFKELQNTAKAFFYANYSDEAHDTVIGATKRSEFSLTSILHTDGLLTFPSPFDIENSEESEEGVEKAILIEHHHDFLRLNEDLYHYDRIEAQVQRAEVGMQKGVFTQVLDYSDDIPIAKGSNTMFSKNWLYSRGYVEKHPILLIDESDNGIKGSKNEVARVMGSYANSVISASGTGTNGKPNAMAYHLGMSGMSSAVIDENAKSFMEQCGVYEIKSDFIKQCLSHDTGTSLARAMDAFRSAKNNKTVMDLSILAQSVVNDILRYLDPVTDVSSIDTNKAKKDIEKVISSSDSLVGNIPGTNEKALQFILMRSRSLSGGRVGVSSLISEFPGINNPKTFTSLVKSQEGNPSIQSRENLKQRDETMRFLDLSKAVEAPGTRLSSLSDDDMKSKLFFEVLKGYAKDAFVMDLFSFLSENFGVFSTMLSKPSNLRIALSSIESDYDHKAFISMMSRSKKSLADDLDSMYRYYIKRNGEMGHVADAYGDEKARVLTLAIKAFETQVLDNIDHFRGMMEKNQKGKVLLKSPDGFEIKGVLRLPEKFSRGVDNEISLNSFEFIDGYPELDGNKVMTSFLISMDNEDWSAFSDYTSAFWFELPNAKNEELIDFYTSSGNDLIFEDEIAQGNKSIIASSRDLGTVFNIFDFIKIAARREDKSEPVVLIVNSQGNKEVSTALRSLDSSFLEKYNIVIAPTSSNRLQATVNEYKNKNVAYNVFSNYISIARGLDLSSMDRIIVTGMLANPNDAIQMLARVFSVDRDDGEIYLFGGGNNYALQNPVSKEEVSSVLVEMMEQGLVSTAKGLALSVQACRTLMPDVELEPKNVRFSQSDKVNLKLYEATKVYKGFMGGTMVSTKETVSQKPYVIAKGYEKRLEALATKKPEQRPVNDKTQTIGV